MGIPSSKFSDPDVTCQKKSENCSKNDVMKTLTLPRGTGPKKSQENLKKPMRPARSGKRKKHLKIPPDVWEEMCIWRTRRTRFQFVDVACEEGHRGFAPSAGAEHRGKRENGGPSNVAPKRAKKSPENKEAVDREGNVVKRVTKKTPKDEAKEGGEGTKTLGENDTNQLRKEGNPDAMKKDSPVGSGESALAKQENFDASTVARKPAKKSGKKDKLLDSEGNVVKRQYIRKKAQKGRDKEGGEGFRTLDETNADPLDDDENLDATKKKNLDCQADNQVGSGESAMAKRKNDKATTLAPNHAKKSAKKEKVLDSEGNVVKRQYIRKKARKDRAMEGGEGVKTLNETDTDPLDEFLNSEFNVVKVLKQRGRPKNPVKCKEMKTERKPRKDKGMKRGKRRTVSVKVTGQMPIVRRNHAGRPKKPEGQKEKCKYTQPTMTTRFIYVSPHQIDANGNFNLSKNQIPVDVPQQGEGSSTQYRIQVVEPLFRQCYVVRRPFADPSLELETELVLHETYFTAQNPYPSQPRKPTQQMASGSSTGPECLPEGEEATGAETQQSGSPPLVPGVATTPQASHIASPSGPEMNTPPEEQLPAVPSPLLRALKLVQGAPSGEALPENERNLSLGEAQTTPTGKEE